jgi:lipopolysaccharide biosynthesis glycosyltransferase
MPDPVRVFVGADRSQALAVKVLAHSIRRHTSLPVEIIPMVDLQVRAPKDIRNSQRTGFSFSRFCIPELAGYRGKAIYMDADMLVFRDIKTLWEIPFDGAKVVIQQEVKHQELTTKKHGSPATRRKQCSVMLLDCARLNWQIDRVIDGFDRGDYNYEMLMYDLCLLGEDEIKYGVPFEWNSLEYYGPETCLIHYTDVMTQPWTSCWNKNGFLWFDEVRSMLEDGGLEKKELEREIQQGFFRPSLSWDVSSRSELPKTLLPLWDCFHSWLDRIKQFKPHRDVYLAKQRRLQAERQRSSQAA